MNKNIEIMLDLQRFWDGVVRGKSEINKANKLIVDLKNEKTKSENNIKEKNNSIKTMKANLKKNEIELTESEDQLKKLNDRKYTVQTERESNALDKEINKITETKDSIEEEMILQMDSLSTAEKEVNLDEKNLTELLEKSKDEIKMLTERIERFKNTVSENETKFNESIIKLEPAMRSKFEKLTRSSDGKAIVELEEKVCSNCRFTLPADDVAKISKRDNVLNCKNCGKYIYLP